jgi:hypothetical protein
MRDKRKELEALKEGLFHFTHDLKVLEDLYNAAKELEKEIEDEDKMLQEWHCWDYLYRSEKL